MKCATLSAVLFCWVSSVHGWAAEFIEITAKLESTWEGPAKTNQHTFRTRCVISTNLWFIEGDFSKNADVSYWFTGLIEQAKDFVSEKILRKPQSGPIASYPRAGETFIKVYPAPQGQPAGSGSVKAVWLAFCSASYLQKNGSQVPLPIGHVKDSWGHTSQTATFDDRPNLPKRVKFFSAEKKSIGTYEVLESTNYLGWTLPLKFKIVQQGVERATGEPSFSTKTELLGTVISIGPGDEPKPPQDVLSETAR